MCVTSFMNEPLIAFQENSRAFACLSLVTLTRSVPASGRWPTVSCPDDARPMTTHATTDKLSSLHKVLLPNPVSHHCKIDLSPFVSRVWI